MTRTDYAVVAKLLRGLDFQEHKHNTHVSFEHAATATVIAFPISRVAEGLTDADLVSARRHLEEAKLLKPGEFDNRIGASQRVGSADEIN